MCQLPGNTKVAVVDIESLKTIAMPGPVEYPDGIAYAPGPKRVFVSDEHGDADAVIDATTNSLLTSIPLGGGRREHRLRLGLGSDHGRRPQKERASHNRPDQHENSRTLSPAGN